MIVSVQRFRRAVPFWSVVGEVASLSAGGQLPPSRPHAVGVNLGVHLEQALGQVPRTDSGRTSGGPRMPDLVAAGGFPLTKLGCVVESVVFTVVRVCGDAPATGCVSRATTFTASMAMS